MEELFQLRLWPKSILLDPFIGKINKNTFAALDFKTLRQRLFIEAFNDPLIELRFDSSVARVQLCEGILNFLHHPESVVSKTWKVQGSLKEQQVQNNIH